MKKRYILVILAIIALTVSGILVINKKSYADKNYQSDLCPSEISHVEYSSDVISLVNNGKNRVQFSIATGYINDYVSIGSMLTTSIYNLYDEFPATRYGFSTSKKSLELGYLLNNEFSNNNIEDNYYKQILLLWATDRLLGFEDNKNYQYNYDDDDNITEVAMDTNYSDKFLNGNWEYVNLLSAGDKEMLLETSNGQKMLLILDDWENYLSLLSEGNLNPRLDDFDLSKISYYVTNDFIETNLIFPSSSDEIYSDMLSSYKVSVPSFAIVLDSKNNEKSVFDVGEGFKVRIPITAVEKNSINFSVKISASFEFPQAILYGKLDERNELNNYYDYLSNIFLDAYVPSNCISYETVTVEKNFEITQKVGGLNVKVIDSSTGNNLSKAEVTIYDLKGNEVYQYETTDKELNITLPVGEYIVKQTITPPNYEAQTIQMRVDVTESGEANAVLENAPLVNVPDTAMNSIIFIIIGGLIVIAGGLLLFTNLRKKESH